MKIVILGEEQRAENFRLIDAEMRRIRDEIHQTEAGTPRMQALVDRRRTLSVLQDKFLGRTFRV